MRLNKVPFVSQNEPLLGTLDRFQEGRSHMAIVSRMSAEQAQSVKESVKKSLTRRLKGAVTHDSSKSSSGDHVPELAQPEGGNDGIDDGKKGRKVEKTRSKNARRRQREKRKKSDTHSEDLEAGDLREETKRNQQQLNSDKERTKGQPTITKLLQGSTREQHFPADAILSKDRVDEYLQTQGIDPAIMPLGIITLEDILEGACVLYTNLHAVH